MPNLLLFGGQNWGKKGLCQPIKLTFQQICTFVSQFYPFKKVKSQSKFLLTLFLRFWCFSEYQNRIKFMAITAKWKFYCKLKKSPSLKIWGLQFEKEIWICCQGHEFSHILMIKDSFGKLRTWGIWSNNFWRHFFDLMD